MDSIGQAPAPQASSLSPVSFIVNGAPVTQGSLSVFQTKSGRAYATNKSKKGLEAYRDTIEWQAKVAFKNRPFLGAVMVELWFVCKKPKRPSNPYPTGDVDKFVRSALDALTGPAFKDDNQVVSLVAHKLYASPGSDPFTRITIREFALPEENATTFHK